MTKNQIARRKTTHHEASPARSLITDLVSLRRTLRRTGRAYLSRLEAELDEVTAWASERANERDLPKSRIRDLGDMITLVRKIDAKPLRDAGAI